MFGFNDVLQRKGTVLNSFIGRDMQDCLLLAKRKFGGAKIHYTGIYNTHAIDPMICFFNVQVLEHGKCF